MAIADTVVLILVIALVGGTLAWAVGRLAERDKEKRKAAGEPHEAERFRRREAPDHPVPAPPRDAAPAPAGGACPTCSTPYRPDIDFCWACGKRRE